MTIDQNELAIIVSDYIAGMTDRFALQTFEKLCQVKFLISYSA